MLFLQHYPTEPPRNLIPYLYDPIKPMLPTNPGASWLFVDRHLKPGPTGTDATNEGLLKATQNDTDFVYAGWIFEQFNTEIRARSFAGTSKADY